MRMATALFLCLVVASCLTESAAMGKKTRRGKGSMRMRCMMKYNELEQHFQNLQSKVDILSNPVHVHVHGVDGAEGEEVHVANLLMEDGEHQRDHSHEESEESPHTDGHHHGDMEGRHGHMGGRRGGRGGGHGGHGMRGGHKGMMGHRGGGGGHNHGRMEGEMRRGGKEGGDKDKGHHKAAKTREEEENGSEEESSEESSEEEEEEDDEKKMGGTHVHIHINLGGQVAGKRKGGSGDEKEDDEEEEEEEVGLGEIEMEGKGNGSCAPHSHDEMNKTDCMKSLYPQGEYVFARCDMIRNSALSTRHNVRGPVYLRQKLGGPIEVRLELYGFDVHEIRQNPEDPRHLHGFHVHQFGDYSNGCNSFGGHFNPTGHTHGGPHSHERHAGDWGNIECDHRGVARTTFNESSSTLFGPESVVGRGIVIHEHADDHGTGGTEASKASGAAGGRIACCVITYSKGMW